MVDATKLFAVIQRANATYRAESSRADRAHNIVVALGELIKEDPQAEGFGTEYVRKHIRSKLGLPTLDGEARLGDLRAHGDALGKHVLYLDIQRHKSGGKDVRVVMVTDANIKRCQDYIEGAQRRRFKM